MAQPQFETKVDAPKVVITTDNKWHKFKHKDDVPASVMKDQFEHLQDDDMMDYYFKYKDWWYNLSDFMVFESANNPFEGWHGYHSDTYFSGTVIRIHSNSDWYMIGRYYS